MDYKQTQLGGFGLVVLLVALVLFVAAVVIDREASTLFDLVVLAVMTAALVVGVVFSRLSVVVTNDRVIASFAFGWPRRVIEIADVAAVRRVANSRWHGLGIRRIPGGWMHNVWGFDTVQLEFASGEVFSIGTVEPDALYDAISSRTTT
jgi:hypothetical protein